MPQPATVFHVMIASPSDVSEARETVHTALTSWNEANTANRGLVLVPLRWETSTVPMLGDHPQAIINKQVVEKADIVFALFGSKLGRATLSAASGTAEEIQEAQQAGKPVHLYFSTAPHANDVDPEQLLALRDFKEELEMRGLYGTFSNPEELNAKVWQAIEHDLQALGATAPAQGAERAGVDIIAQPIAENQPTTDSRGHVRNKTKRWVELNNRGDADAFDLTVDSATDGVVIIGPDNPTILHGGQSRRFPMVLTAQAGDPIVTVRWTESGEPVEKTFHVG